MGASFSRRRRPGAGVASVRLEGSHWDDASSHRMMIERVVSLEGALQAQGEEMQAMAAAISSLQAEVSRLKQSSTTTPLTETVSITVNNIDDDVTGLTPTEQVERRKAALVQALDATTAETAAPSYLLRLQKRAKQYAQSLVEQLEADGSVLPASGVYTDPAALFDTLGRRTADGLVPVRLVRLSWLLARAAKARLACGNDEALSSLALPRRQQLEHEAPDAFFSLEELRALPCSEGGAVAIGAVSYSWLTADRVWLLFDLVTIHSPTPRVTPPAANPDVLSCRPALMLLTKRSSPVALPSCFYPEALLLDICARADPDPFCEQLVALADVIENAQRRNMKRFPAEAAVFIDFVSLLQKDAQGQRTNAEQACFGEALHSMQTWYCHSLSFVVMLSKLPQSKRWEGLTPYHGRGWCTCEASWAQLAKLDSKQNWPMVLDTGAITGACRPPPMAPEPMSELIASKRFTSAKADLPKVVELNVMTIFTIFRDVTTLNFSDAGWGADEAVQLAEVLPFCKALEKLLLVRNHIGDRGAEAIGRWLPSTSSLKTLGLIANKIGVQGAAALAQGLKRNRSMEVVFVGFNQLGKGGVHALQEARESRGSGLQIKFS